jgi:cell division protease FtsH
MEEFDKAKDKIMMGSERKSMVMSEEEKTNTAYHEAGHAIVGRLVPKHDPVYKVSIIPRGNALGVTMYLPEQDKYSNSREELESRIATLFGGRIAEEITLGAAGVTTGASNDIERATQIARKMVTSWGLSSKMGPINYEDDENERYMGGGNPKSAETVRDIDAEMRLLIDRNYASAEQILKDNMDILEAMKDALMKYETIDARQIDDLMNRVEVRPPADWEKDVKTDSNRPSGGATINAGGEAKDAPSSDPSDVTH